jgi:hypothetical protein
MSSKLRKTDRPSWIRNPRVILPALLLTVVVGLATFFIAKRHIGHYNAYKVFISIYQASVDSYFTEALSRSDQMSNVRDIQSRLDALCKGKGFKNWSDLCTKAAQANPEGFKDACQEISRYCQDRATEFSKAISKVQSAGKR